MSGFDLSTINLAATSGTPTTMLVRDPRTDEPIVIGYAGEGAARKPVHVELDLLGMESDAGRAVKRALQAKRLSRISKGKRVQLTPELHEEEKVALLTVLVVGWRGVEWKGAPLDCTPPNVRMLLREPIMSWLVDQIEEHVGNLEHYLGKSEGGSSDSPAVSSTSVSE